MLSDEDKRLLSKVVIHLEIIKNFLVTLPVPKMANGIQECIDCLREIRERN